MMLKLVLVAASVAVALTIPVGRNQDDQDEEILKNGLNDEESSEEEYPDLKKTELDKIIRNVLEEYYDKMILPNFDASKSEENSLKFDEKETQKYGKYFDEIENNGQDGNVQGDMAAVEAGITEDVGLKINIPIENITNSNLTYLLTNATKLNSTFMEQLQKTREKYKQEWVLNIQNKILLKTGRKNNTSVPKMIAGPLITVFNRSDIILPIPKTADSDEKMRSFYPSCEMPRNTDEEAWKDVNIMNLYFNVDYNSGNSNTAATDQQGQEDTINIASATLRLYRLPQDNNATFIENCQKSASPHSVSDDDKLIRVSVYWYSRSLKKHKAVKRRLADSRMVPLFEGRSSSSSDSAVTAPHYVEFNVRPATKTWVRGRNLGLGVVVEDMDGAVLQAGRYFKGIGCDTVGNVSTPIPIPTAVLDANRGSNRFGHANNGSSSVTSAYDSLVPKLDICTVEFPQNESTDGQPPIDASKIICKILTSLDDSNQKILGDVQHRNADGSESGRHIRHQHHFNTKNTQKETDFRDMINNKIVVMNSSQLNDYNKQFQARNNSDRNR